MANGILNTIWFCAVGWAIAGIMLVLGIVFCCTFIGIPVGIACFKQVQAVSFPFGRQSGSGGITIVNDNRRSDD